MSHNVHFHRRAQFDTYKPYRRNISAVKKGKKIPEWASKSNELCALKTQSEEPDKTFRRLESINLEEVFASTQQSKIRYRS